MQYKLTCSVYRGRAPVGVWGQSPGGGLGAKPPEADKNCENNA